MIDIAQVKKMDVTVRGKNGRNDLRNCMTLQGQKRQELDNANKCSVVNLTSRGFDASFNCQDRNLTVNITSSQEFDRPNICHVI